MSRSKKPPAAPPIAIDREGLRLVDLVRAAPRVLGSKLPGAGPLIALALQASTESRAKREATWERYILDGEDDPAEFIRHLRAAMDGADGDVVRTAITDSIRAAFDASDDIVISSIALLARRFIKTKSPTLRTCRDVQAMLETLDAEVFVALRAAVHTMVRPENANGGFVVTNFIIDDTTRTWNWYAIAPGEHARTSSAVPLATGDIAARIVASLSGTRTLFDGDTIAPGKPKFQLAMLNVLVDIMPLP